MSTYVRTKQDICHDCNIFHIACTGEMFERSKGTYKKECVNQVRSHGNIESKIQVAAFYSLFKTKRRCGVDVLWAFVEAIVQSSDEVFAEAKLKHPHLIKQWKNNKKGKEK